MNERTFVAAALMVAEVNRKGWELKGVHDGTDVPRFPYPCKATLHLRLVRRGAGRPVRVKITLERPLSEPTPIAFGKVRFLTNYGGSWTYRIDNVEFQTAGTHWFHIFLGEVGQVEDEEEDKLDEGEFEEEPVTSIPYQVVLESSPGGR